MLKWVSSLFKPAPDRVEASLLNIFDFLLKDFGFSYQKEKLGDAVDKDGKFIFYGPLNAYQFYNKNICISFLHLMQRDDYNVYITDKKCNNQVYIINGVELPSYLAYNLPLFAKELKEALLNCEEFYGHKF